jgi:hypothetical protein
MYTVYCELHTVHCTLHCTLCTVHCALCTVHCALYTVHCTLYTVHCTLYTSQHKQPAVYYHALCCLFSFLIHQLCSPTRDTSWPALFRCQTHVYVRVLSSTRVPVSIVPSLCYRTEKLRMVAVSHTCTGCGNRIWGFADVCFQEMISI